MSDNNVLSIGAIASALNVSKATVSRALNGSPGVSDAVRKKIVDYANEIGYVPNTLAQSLAKGRQNIIALILEDIRNPFYAEMAFQLQKLLEENGYMLMVFSSEHRVERELNFINTVSNSSFAGLIALTVQSQSVEDAIKRLKMPVVLVNRTLPSFEGNSVLLDNFQAGYLAARHLIELKHRRIGFVRGPQTSSASQQRYLGFCQAVENFHAEHAVEYSLEMNLSSEAGFHAARSFLENAAPRPSAMIISNDLAAISFMDELRAHGIRIPEDLSIVSFDNISIAATRSISLTTVDQHINEISREAIRILMYLQNHPNAEPERIIISPTLVVRNTTRLFV